METACGGTVHVFKELEKRNPIHPKSIKSISAYGNPNLHQNLLVRNDATPLLDRWVSNRSFLHNRYVRRKNCPAISYGCNVR